MLMVFKTEQCLDLTNGVKRWTSSSSEFWALNPAQQCGLRMLQAQAMS